MRITYVYIAGILPVRFIWEEVDMLMQMKCVNHETVAQSTQMQKPKQKRPKQAKGSQDHCQTNACAFKH